LEDKELQSLSPQLIYTLIFLCWNKKKSEL